MKNLKVLKTKGSARFIFIIKSMKELTNCVFINKIE